MEITDWFNKPASNAMLDNSFRNQFYQSNVQPVQSGATNVRPTNMAALKNWTPWKAFMPQSMGGTFYTGGTPQALGALNTAKNFGLGALRFSGLTNPVGAAAMSAYAAPKLINALTERDPDATKSSLFGIDLTRNANEQAALPDVGANPWGSPMGDIPVAGDDIQEQVTETETIDPYTGRNMRDIAGEVGEYNNIGNIRLNEMERIIANQEFKEQPGIHFKNDPIENIFNRRNDPTKGVIDRNFKYKELNNPPGLDDNTSNFPSILNMVTEGLGKFRDKFLPTMSPEKQAEVAALGINPDKYGWGTLPGSGLKGQIHNDKVYVANPFGGNLLQNKNLHGSNRTIAEMLQGKEDWAGGQFEKYGDTWTDKDHKGISEDLYNYYKSTGALQNWQNAAINKPVVDTTTVDNMIIDGADVTGGGKISPPGPRMEQSQYDDYMAQPGRDLGHGMTIEDRSQIADTWARGGRVGYFDGGLAGLL